MSRARRGEVEAYAQLVTRYQDYIYNAVVRLVSSEHEAEDLAQEVFLKAYRGLREFRRDATFKTWLYGIMLNTVRSHWRTRGRKPEAMSLDAEDADGNPTFDPPADTDDPVEGVMRADRIEIVRRAIGELEEELREVIVLRDIQGLSYEELADSLGLPIGTVKSRLFRARGMLKDKVAPVLQEDA